jgi:hypothetical protein
MLEKPKRQPHLSNGYDKIKRELHTIALVW